MTSSCPHLAADLVFIDGPLRLFILHASAQEIRDAHARIGKYLDVYCASHARAVEPAGNPPAISAHFPRAARAVSASAAGFQPCNSKTG